MAKFLLLLDIGPKVIFAQDSGTDALIQLFIMIIIMAFAVIGNILKARSDSRPKKVRKLPVRNPQEPVQPSPEDLSKVQQFPIHEREKIPYAAIHPRYMHGHPRQAWQSQPHTVQEPVIPSQPPQEKESLVVDEKSIFPQKVVTTIELKQSLLKLQPDDLCQAVLFHEILGRPLSIRDIDDSPF